MKLLFLSFHSGHVSRGVETFVHEIANELVGLGHSVKVIQGGSKLPGSKYEVNVVPSKSLFSFSLKSLKYIKNFDVIVPNNGRWMTLLVRAASIFLGKRMVIVGHSGPGIDDRFNLFLRPDYFVALTSPQERWAKGTAPFTRVIHIPDGANTELFKPGKKINLGLRSPVILIVSALIKSKRINLAIEAVSKLTDGSLLIVGAGPEKVELEKIGQELLPGRFDIRTYKYSEMSSVYSSADLFTFPTSPWESTGLSLLEAMACNLPVVASDDPIRREIVGDAGVFVDPTDSSKYAEGINKALEKNWGETPRNWAKKFSWKEIAKKYEELFIRLNDKK